MMRAEVIGDPIAHSKSPLIHRFWLECLGMDGSYEATLVKDVGPFLARRRVEPGWRGCNVTAPYKQAVLRFLDTCDLPGAVNCVIPDRGRLIGRNTDVDGIAEALAGTDLSKVVLIGNGGAAVAARACLAKAEEIVTVTRETIDRPDMAGATLIINATPLGMSHAAPMPEAVLRDLPAGATIFDMVYQPRDTALLKAARARGLRTVDGLSMLIGQAREAFRLFYGAVPPRDRDAELRARLTA